MFQFPNPGTNPVSGRTSFSITDTEHVQLSHLRLTDGDTGVSVGNSENIQIEWVEAFGHKNSGFSVNKVNGIQFSHCAAWSNESYGLTINHAQTQSRWDHGVIGGRIQMDVCLWGRATPSSAIPFSMPAVSQATIYTRDSMFSGLGGDYNAFWLGKRKFAGERYFSYC